MRDQVETWRTRQLSDEVAKLIIYRAFIEGDPEVPKLLARVVHNRYFDPQYQEFTSRTMWSLSKAFTSAMKELEAIPRFRATAKLGGISWGRSDSLSESRRAGEKCKPQAQFPSSISVKTKDKPVV